MKHEDFKINANFWMGGKRWRCTDVGTRTVCAILLYPRYAEDNDAVIYSFQSVKAPDDSWFNGPPYPVVEEVLDENDMEACHEEWTSGYSEIYGEKPSLPEGYQEKYR